MAQKNKKHKLIDYPVIVAATHGDELAIQSILNSYAGYIAVLAMRETCDQYGNIHYTVDEELRGRMESKLIQRILKFQI